MCVIEQVTMGPVCNVCRARLRLEWTSSLWLYVSAWNDTISPPRSSAGQVQILGLFHNSATQCFVVKYRLLAPFVWRTLVSTIAKVTKSGGGAQPEIWPHVYFIFLKSERKSWVA